MKRGAEEQLTKDSADRDEQGSPALAGTFEKAPPEVLAKRRILKVPRRVTVAPAAGGTKPANPFANLAKKIETPPSGNGISQQQPKPPESQAKEPEPQTAAPASNNQVEPKEEAEKDAVEKQQESGDGASTGKANQEIAETGSANERAVEDGGAREPNSQADEDNEKVKGNDANTSGVEKQAEDKPEEAKEVEKAGEGSTEKDSEETGERATAEEAKQEAVQEQGKEGSEANQKAVASDAGDEKKEEHEQETKAEENELIKEANGATNKPVFTFGNADGGPALTFANAAAADSGSFNIKVTPAPPPTKPAPAKEFKEAEVQTGEEDESELFRARSKLYSLEMKDGAGRWRERGIGSLKLNKHKESGKVRLLMRTEATLRVVLNTPVFTEFKIDRATEKSLRIQGYDVDDVEGKNITSFLLRFPSKDIATGLVEAIESWQKNVNKEEE